MTDLRAGEQQRVADGWSDIPQAARVPARSETTGERRAAAHHAPSAPSAPATPATSRRWWHWPLRVVRDALIAATVITSIPVAYSVTGTDVAWRRIGAMSTPPQLQWLNGLRVWKLPTDATITPLEGGRAYARLARMKAGADYPLRDVGASAPLRNINRDIPVNQFPDARPRKEPGPSSAGVLQAVARGLTPDELATLRDLAALPQWRDFDRVARAAQVDLIGAQFQLPFSPEANVQNMPFTPFAPMRDLAHASVSRAAYYLAIGDHQRAEAALRSAISVGFALVDNGTEMIDQVAGRTIINIGREGLQRYFEITHDARATALASAPPRRLMRIAGGTSGDDFRAYLIRAASSPTTPRGERFEWLRALPLTSCSNVGELLLGPSPDVVQAFAQAKRDLARFPSERALLDLMVSGDVPKVDLRMYSPGKRWLIGAATIGSAITGNPRIATCAILRASP